MGLFDGIKRNLNIGGPKISGFDGPNACSLGDEVAPLRFMLVGGGDDAHVVKITLQLRRERVQRQGTSTNRQTTTVRDAVFDNNGVGWDIAAEETVPFEFALPLNTAIQVQNADIAGHMQNQRPDLTDEQAAMAEKMMNGVGRFLQTAGAVDEMMHPDDRWTFKVIVDVDRVVLDPAAEIRTHIVGPGEFFAGVRRNG